MHMLAECGRLQYSRARAFGSWGATGLNVLSDLASTQAQKGDCRILRLRAF